MAQLLISGIGYTQGMQVGNILVINQPILKSNVDPGAFQTFATKEILPALEKQSQGPTYHLFKADRGKQKGSFLLVCYNRYDKSSERPLRRKLLSILLPWQMEVRLLEILSAMPTTLRNTVLVDGTKLNLCPTQVSLVFISYKSKRNVQTSLRNLS